MVRVLLVNMRKLMAMKHRLWIVPIIFSGYVLYTEYGYYHNSVRDSGLVSAVHYVSTTERKMSGDCHLARDTCAGLYSYDTTWRQGEQSYVFHTDRELNPPARAMCVQFVQNDPSVAKLCHHLFFNASFVPYLIAIWSIAAFMSLTRFVHHKLHPRLPVLKTWRIIDRRHHLLLETQEREEALRFIGKGYRICHTTRGQEVIRVGRKKVDNHYTVYFVRASNGTRRR